VEHVTSGRGATGDNSDEAEWGGRMGTVTQGENGATSIGARGRDNRIRSLGKRRMRE
jgi:hypothetical protein